MCDGILLTATVLGNPLGKADGFAVGVAVTVRVTVGWTVSVTTAVRVTVEVVAGWLGPLLPEHPARSAPAMKGKTTTEMRKLTV
ncbi:hypothetical protein GCM10027039_38340 [Terrabacter koreensis]